MWWLGQPELWELEKKHSAVLPLDLAFLETTNLASVPFWRLNQQLPSMDHCEMTDCVVHSQRGSMDGRAKRRRNRRLLNTKQIFC